MEKQIDLLFRYFPVDQNSTDYFEQLNEWMTSVEVAAKSYKTIASLNESIERILPEYLTIKNEEIDKIYSSYSDYTYSAIRARIAYASKIILLYLREEVIHRMDILTAKKATAESSKKPNLLFVGVQRPDSISQKNANILVQIFRLNSSAENAYNIYDISTVKASDIQKEIKRRDLDLIHLSGLGKAGGLKGGICDDSDSDSKKIVISSQVILNILMVYVLNASQKPKLVLLDFDYSSNLGEELSKGISCHVISFPRTLFETKALHFLIDFYDYFFQGQNIKDAFEFSLNLFETDEGQDDTYVPKLYINGKKWTPLYQG